MMPKQLHHWASIIGMFLQFLRSIPTLQYYSMLSYPSISFRINAISICSWESHRRFHRMLVIHQHQDPNSRALLLANLQCRAGQAPAGAKRRYEMDPQSPHGVMSRSPATTAARSNHSTEKETSMFAIAICKVSSLESFASRFAAARFRSKRAGEREESDGYKTQKCESALRKQM